MGPKTIRNIAGKFSTRGVKVRTAMVSDLSGMTGLLSELFSLESDFTPNIRKQRQGLGSLMESETATLLVAVTKDEIIGMCTLQPLISTAEGGTVGMVEDLVVTEQWRNKGIGAMLLEAIENIAKEQGMSRLQLLNDKSNETANRFYDNHEWSKTNMIARRKTFK